MQLVIIILVIILFIVTIVLIVLTTIYMIKQKSIIKADIIHNFNDTSFDENNLPNGGLLISMIANDYACKIDNFTDYPKSKKCHDKNDIKDKNVADLKDINKLLQDTKVENYTSCNSIDATYTRTDVPVMLFGPVLGGSMTEPINMSIGLILDVNKLKKYTGCMYLSDSGSTGRYNFSRSDGTVIPANNISDDDLDDYNKLILSPKGAELSAAGCGLQVGTYSNDLGGIINPQYKDGKPLPFGKSKLPKGSCPTKLSTEVNYWPGAYSTKTFRSGNNPIDYNVGVLVDKDYEPLSNDQKQNGYGPYDLPNGWFNNIYDDKGKVITDKSGFPISNFLSGYFGNTNQPYSKNSWKYFIEQLKRKIKNINDFGGNAKLWQNLTYAFTFYANPYSIPNSLNPVNIYTENEIDIFIPNKYREDANAKCSVTDKFKEVWADAVIGIFTNHRCAEDVKYSSTILSQNLAPDPKNPHKLCTVCSKKCSNPKTDPGLCCGCFEKRTAGICDDKIPLDFENISEGGVKPMCSMSCDNINCCCSNNNYEYLDAVVIALVKKYNKNSKRKINGYVMNDDMKIDQDYPKDWEKHKLQIKQLTNY